MTDRIKGTPGGPANRLLRRNTPKQESVESYQGDGELRLKMRDSLGSREGQEILLVIVEEARKRRKEVFERAKSPDDKMAAIGRVAVYRELVEAIFTKANIPIPPILEEVLN